MKKADIDRRIHELTSGDRTRDEDIELNLLLEKRAALGMPKFWQRRSNLAEQVALLESKLALAATLTGKPNRDEKKEALRAAGYLFEEIAATLLAGLAAASRFRRYQSDTYQHDALVYGDTLVWHELCRRLRFPAGADRILAEVKAVDGRVGLATMGRLGDAISTMKGRVGLGLIICVNGIADFPDPASKQVRHCRKGAWLRQATHFAQHGVPILELRLDEIKMLASKPSADLFEVLRDKIDALVDQINKTAERQGASPWNEETRFPHALCALGLVEEEQ